MFVPAHGTHYYFLATEFPLHIDSDSNHDARAPPGMDLRLHGYDPSFDDRALTGDRVEWAEWVDEPDELYPVYAGGYSIDDIALDQAELPVLYTRNDLHFR